MIYITKFLQSANKTARIRFVTRITYLEATMFNYDPLCVALLSQMLNRKMQQQNAPRR